MVKNFMKMYNCDDQAQLWQRNENMQNVCQRHQNRPYAPIVSLNNIHQCGAVVLKIRCYFCHSSVVCSLRAPPALNSQWILKLFHSYSSYILTSLACGVFTIRFTLLFFFSHSTGEFVLKIPSISWSESDCTAFL